MGVYTEAEGLMKVDATILHLVGSNQFSYGCVIANKIRFPTNCNPILENTDHAQFTHFSTFSFLMPSSPENASFTFFFSTVSSFSC